MKSLLFNRIIEKLFSGAQKHIILSGQFSRILKRGKKIQDTHVKHVLVGLAVVLARELENGVGGPGDYLELQVHHGHYGVGRHVRHEPVGVGGLVELKQPLVRRHFCRPLDPVHLHGATEVGVLTVVPGPLKFEKCRGCTWKKKKRRRSVYLLRNSAKCKAAPVASGLPTSIGCHLRQAHQWGSM